jgi:hypothetical protein
MGTSGNASTHENYNEEGANGSQVLTEEQVEALIRSEELAASFLFFLWIPGWI